MRASAIVIAAVGACLAVGQSALAQSAPPPEMHMHRVQAGTLDATGWTLAASTEGAFSVRLPCKFNDYTVDIKEAGAIKGHLFMVGCDRADGVRFSAMRFQWVAPNGGQETYDRYVREGLAPGATFRSDTFKGFPSVYSSYASGGKCAWARALHVGGEVLVVMVEPVHAPCTDLKAVADKYFDTAEVKSR